MLLNLLKKVNAWLHLWLGLVSGLIVLVVSITGCVLVFEQEIKSISSPWLHVSVPAGRASLPPSELYRAAKAALPDKEIRSVWYHGQGKTAHLATSSDTLIYINPYTAEIAALVDHEDFFHFIDEGHRHLWLPEEIGRPVVGWATFIFLLLLISGLVLWWPAKFSKANARRSFLIKWNARFKRLNYDLHNVLGFYSVLLALLMAITGLIMSFSWFNMGVYWLSGGDNPLKPDTQESFGAPLRPVLESVDNVWRKVQTEVALYNKDQIIISFPTAPEQPIYACTDMINGHWRDLYFRQSDLELSEASMPATMSLPFADKLRKLNFTMHVGAFAGVYSKSLYFIVSLICASLPVTGFYVWWGKRKKTKALVLRKVPPAKVRA